MKFWKKNNGDCGTVDDNGFVPDSVEIMKIEYDKYVASQPIIESVNEIIEYEDVDSGKILKLREVI